MFEDPIFSAFNKEPYRNYIFLKSQKIAPNIQIRWADGYPYSKLELLKKNKNLLLTNNIVVDADQYQHNIHTVDPSYYGLMHCAYDVDASTPVEKNFNCFSNRFDIFRQSWFYHLIRRDWLNLGYVSFNCETTTARVPNSGYLGLDEREIFEKAFQEHNQIFHQEHVKIKDQIPYRNFLETGDLTNLVLGSKFSIILETWFDDNRIITFSEKTMRCLQLPRPWVLFSVQYGIQQLRQWGFDVLDDVVDHSYDNISGVIERQVAILELSDQLMELDIKKIASRCHEASKHNQSLLKTWNNNWVINMDRDFEIARQKALAL
jgi:hypothetical protein